MSSQQIVPLNYITVSIENWDDIQKAVNCSPDVKKAVDNNNNKHYTTIDVGDAIKKLAIVGDLLKVANAAARGFPCSVPIIGILSDYQSLVNDTVYTTSQFVYLSIAALSQHSLALRVAEKYPQKALALLGKTSDKAKEMADICQKLVDMSKALVDKSDKALKLATSDQVAFIDKEKENQKAQADLDIKAAKLKSEIEDLKGQVEELKELAVKASRNAAIKRNFGMVLQILGAVFQPLIPTIVPVGVLMSQITRSGQSSSCSTNGAASKIKEKKEKIEKQVEDKNKELEAKQEELKKVEAEPDTPEKIEKKEKLNKQIDEIKGAIKLLENSFTKVMNDISKEYKEIAAKSEDKEAEYRKLKNQFQDLQRKSNADLAENLVKLKSLSDEKNYLELSTKSLEIIIITMGNILTIFRNTGLFWLQVESQCKNLIDISNIKDLSELSDLDKDFQTDYMNQIKNSGFNWLALAKINYDAANAIISVKKNFDEVMSNLPGKEEALRIVKECTGEIEQALKDENNKIAETQKQIQQADGNRPSLPVSA